MARPSDRRNLDHPLHERDRAEIDMNEYQTQAFSLALYPRVYTEQQVRTMLVQAYIRSSHPKQEQITLDAANEYAEHDLSVAETPFNRLVYPLLGLLGEAGEISNKLKKVARDDSGSWGPDSTQDYAAELGDVLWYVSAIASELDVPLASVANHNLDKLFSRKARGVLGGSGDNR